jgi:hypothetical protein
MSGQARWPQFQKRAKSDPRKPPKLTGEIRIIRAHFGPTSKAAAPLRPVYSPSLPLSLSLSLSPFFFSILFLSSIHSLMSCLPGTPPIPGSVQSVVVLPPSTSASHVFASASYELKGRRDSMEDRSMYVSHCLASPVFFLSSLIHFERAFCASSPFHPPAPLSLNIPRF